MLISYSHKFIFIHIYKVAGTSIKRGLDPYAHRPEQLLLNRAIAKLQLNLHVPHHTYKTFRSHALARDVRAALPASIYDRFYKFAFVRNPWDWHVSLYHYMLQTPTHKNHSMVKRLGGFEGYIDWLVSVEPSLQKEFVTDEHGRLIVDYVGRFENLSADFDVVCQRIGVLNTLPLINRSSHRDYRTYYSDRTAAMLGEHLREDLEFFGYTFESTPTFDVVAVH